MSQTQPPFQTKGILGCFQQIRTPTTTFNTKLCSQTQQIYDFMEKALKVMKCVNILC